MLVSFHFLCNCNCSFSFPLQLFCFKLLAAGSNTMVDLQIYGSSSTARSVCCMCGDVGFPDKLFRCTKSCCNRFQHSYCRNYYDESTGGGGNNIGGELLVCDWCLSEEGRQRSSSTTTTTTSKKNQSGGVLISGGGIIVSPPAPSTSKKSIGNYKEGRSSSAGVNIKIKQNDLRSTEEQYSDTTSSGTSTTQHQQQQDQKGVLKHTSSGTPSPKTPGGRRYKFLKDVLC